MIGNLRQIERDRAVLLAGVSHDLRTPLARLRLGIEMSARDEATRAAWSPTSRRWTAIIGQFLDFARDDAAAAPEKHDLNRDRRRLRRALRERGARRALRAGDVPPVALRATAMSRLVANLIDNALAYGAPPVEVRRRGATTR